MSNTFNNETIIVIDESDNDEVQILSAPKASLESKKMNMKKKTSTDKRKLKTMQEDGDDAIAQIIAEGLEDRLKNTAVKKMRYNSTVNVNRLFQSKSLKAKVAEVVSKTKVLPRTTLELSLGEEDDDNCSLYTGQERFAWFATEKDGNTGHARSQEPIAPSPNISREEKATMQSATRTPKVRPNHQQCNSSVRSREAKTKVLNPFRRQQMPKMKVVHKIYDEDGEEENYEQFVSNLTKQQKDSCCTTSDRVNNLPPAPGLVRRVQCPICKALYPRDEIEEHAEDCQGVEKNSAIALEHSIAAAVAKKKKELESRRKDCVADAGPTNYYADEESILALDGNGFNSEVTGISWESAGQMRFE